MQVASVNLMTSLNEGTQSEDQKLRKVSSKVLGSVFYGTLLKTMRDSAIKGPYGHGGRGEEIFTAQLHGILTERLGEGSDPTKENFLYEWLSRQQRVVDLQETTVGVTRS